MKKYIFTIILCFISLLSFSGERWYSSKHLNIFENGVWQEWIEYETPIGVTDTKISIFAKYEDRFYDYIITKTIEKTDAEVSYYCFSMVEKKFVLINIREYTRNNKVERQLYIYDENENAIVFNITDYE